MILDNLTLIDNQGIEIPEIDKVCVQNSFEMSVSADPKRPRSATSSPIFISNRRKLAKTNPHD